MADKKEATERKFSGSTKEVEISILKDHGKLKKGSTHVVSECTAEQLTDRGIADKNWKEVKEEKKK